MNLIYSANNAILQPFILFYDVHPKSAYCSVVAFTTSFSGLGGVFLRSLVAFNRFISLFYPEKQNKMFSCKNNVSMVGLIVLASLLISIILYLLGDMARLGDTVCGPDIEKMPFTHTLIFMVPVSVVNVICIYSGYKIWIILSGHQENAQRVGSRLQDTKEIFRLIIIEQMIPLLLETPIVLASLLRYYVVIPKTLLSCFVCLFITYPVVEPVIVVLVMKPYKSAVQRQWYLFRGVSPIEEVSIVSSNNAIRR